jgi:hypothetical protein
LITDYTTLPLQSLAHRVSEMRQACDNGVVRRRFEEVKPDLAKNWASIFSIFLNWCKTNPLQRRRSAKSIEARLKANGDLAALKIQRPNCEEIISLDLYVLRWWSGIYSGIFRLLKRDINVQCTIHY